MPGNAGCAGAGGLLPYISPPSPVFSRDSGLAGEALRCAPLLCCHKAHLIVLFHPIIPNFRFRSKEAGSLRIDRYNDDTPHRSCREMKEDVKVKTPLQYPRAASSDPANATRPSLRAPSLIRIPLFLGHTELVVSGVCKMTETVSPRHHHHLLRHHRLITPGAYLN